LGCSTESQDNFDLYGQYVLNGDIPFCVNALNKQYGSIGNFRTTNAAHDLAFLINNLNMPAITVYGVSYGTYLLNRFMQFYPNLADTLVLDGICPPSVCDIAALASRYGEALENFLDICNNNSFCQGKLGGDAVKLYLGIKNTSKVCAPFVSYDDFSNTLFGLLDDPIYWSLIPPILYRVNRCNIEDSGAIENIFNALANAPSIPISDDETYPQPWASSDILFDIIAYSELYNYSVQQNNYDSSVNAFFPVDASTFITRRDVYVTNNYLYNDIFANEYPSIVNSRVLLMNGDIDTRTPLSWSMGYSQALSKVAPNTQYNIFNNSAHGLIDPARNPTKGYHPCSVDMMGDWISGAQLNISANPCIANIRPYPLSEAAAQAFFDQYGVVGFSPYDGGALPGWLIAVIVIVIVIAVIAAAAIFIHFYCHKQKNPSMDDNE